VRAETAILLIAMAALLFVMYSRMRRQQRETELIQAGLVPGADIMTGSGLFATVVAVVDDVVVLETAPGSRSRWNRRAVARIVSSPPGAADGATTDPEDADGTAGPDQATDGDPPDRA
jgi:preprotein translocase subunit YajC